MTETREPAVQQQDQVVVGKRVWRARAQGAGPVERAQTLTLSSLDAFVERRPRERPASSRAAPPQSGGRRRIALIAHDNMKPDMLEWARFNRDILAQHELFATGTTGSILASELDLTITLYRSGPLGGDQQVGASVVEGVIDLVVFFWDPLEPHPHDVDVKALLRIAVVYNIPIACNRASADFLISSPLLHAPHHPRRKAAS
jgi:methylglyoxal synthase